MAHFQSSHASKSDSHIDLSVVVKMPLSFKYLKLEMWFSKSCLSACWKLVGASYYFSEESLKGSVWTSEALAREKPGGRG